MTEEPVAEEVARMLAERDLTLGTVECGVGGIVSRRLFDTEEGGAVLGNSLVVDDVEEAIGLLDLPRPQFKKAGDFSAKAARAGAREGRAFLGVSLCLAVWGQAPIDEEGQRRPECHPEPAEGPIEGQTVHVALNTGREVSGQTFEVGGQSGRGADWLVDQALEMVRRALVK